MKIVAVDAGKFGCKSLSRDTDKTFRDYFRTKVDENGSVASTQSEKTYRVKYNSVNYVVGEDALKADYDTDKGKDMTKIAIYTAITRHLPATTESELVLPIGCPLNMFREAEVRENYKKFME
jgi:plasmid segregation protein ParM